MCCYGWLAGKQKEASLTSTPLLAAACGCSTLYFVLGLEKTQQKKGLQLSTASIDRRALPLPTAEGYYYVRVGNWWNKIAFFFYKAKLATDSTRCVALDCWTS